MLVSKLYRSDTVPFPKDQKSDHEFPARLARSPGLPFGHLRPLGTQRKPEGKLKEFDGSLISSNAFYEATKQARHYLFLRFLFAKNHE